MKLGPVVQEEMSFKKKFMHGRTADKDELKTDHYLFAGYIFFMSTSL